METKSGRSLSKLGIGTWGVGGRGHRPGGLTDITKDDNQYIAALVYQFQQGLNFTEVSLGYGHGNSIRLLREAITRSDVGREDLFITQSLYMVDLEDITTIQKDLTDFYKILQTDYADSTLVTQSTLMKFGKENVYKILHQLLDTGKTRYVSLSNAGKSTIADFKDEFGDNFHAHEGHLSFEVRLLQEEGILDLCDQLGVRNIIWRPLRKGATSSKHWPLLEELATKYGKTTNQIILNWMMHLSYAPMVFSTNKHHIDENVASGSFSMTNDEYQTMTEARPVKLDTSHIDWESGGLDNDIVPIANNLHG